MTPKHTANHLQILRRIARRAMIDRGFLPDFAPQVRDELAALKPAPVQTGLRDLRELPWCSIDNDESRDLDQLTVAREGDNGAVTIFVAIADVDTMVPKGRAIDDHACHNTTSIYTAAQIFPMIPETLSTGLTSLNDGEDRASIVVELTVAAGGVLDGSDVYRALVRNRAKLAYNSVAAWLDGAGPAPGPVTAVKGLDANLRIQDRVARMLRTQREAHGALNLETVEANPVFEGDQVKSYRIERKNRARELIEELHDRGKRGRRPLSRIQEGSVDPPCRPGSQALGPDCRRGLGAGLDASGGARLESPRGVPHGTEGPRPGAFP